MGFGMAAKNKKQGWFIFIPIFLLFLLSLFVLYYFEKQGTPMFTQYGMKGINMEGKEMRFGFLASILFTDVTTSFTTGSVNNMHDSLTPMGSLVSSMEYDVKLHFWWKRCRIYEYNHVYDFKCIPMWIDGGKNSRILW